MRNEQPPFGNDPDRGPRVRTEPYLRTAPRLRTDLGCISIEHDDRPARIVIDDIGGQFARIPNHLWNLLVNRDADPESWNQAAAAGWTCNRLSRPKSKLSILAVRIPLFNVDFVARHLSAVTDWIFASTAIKFWVAMMFAAAFYATSQYREILTTIEEMPNFFSSSAAWVLGSVFVGTKLLHEFGHAIACRRLGVRCGKFGVILFCGVPCPFCDVTQVWRNPSAKDRAAVMLAGMYVEGILATVATIIWALADDGPARLHAMNVMIICSLSTLVFNANPLMRYDGYYVLSDWVGSVNLRSESRTAFSKSIQQIVRHGRGGLSSNLNRRTIGLVVYYLASTVYRYLVLMTIAAAVFIFADSLGLKLIAAIGILCLVTMMTARLFKRSSKQSKNSSAKKLITAIFAVLLLGSILAVPVPRRITARGFVDAADATEVFLKADGIIESVTAKIGQEVTDGQELALVRDDQLAIEAAGVLGKIQVASYRTRTARRQTLDDFSSSKQLESFRAVESALQANLISLNRQQSKLSTRAPISGTVLPTLDLKTTSNNHPWKKLSNLTDRIGMRSDKGMPWCRIASSKKLGIVLHVDAKYRESVSEGMIVRGHELQSPTTIINYRVVSISSALAPGPSSPRHNETAIFDVLCEPISDATNDRTFLSRIGGPCEAVIELPSRAIATDLFEFFNELLT